jgi:hypothetical protein
VAHRALADAALQGRRIDQLAEDVVVHERCRSVIRIDAELDRAHAAAQVAQATGSICTNRGNGTASVVVINLGRATAVPALLATAFARLRGAPCVTL